MKTLTRTSVMVVIAMAGLLALMAGTALAAPAEAIGQAWQHEALVDQLQHLDEGILQQAVPLIPQPDDGGADDGGIDEGGADDGGADDGGVDDGGADDGGADDGGADDGGIDEGGADDGGADDGGADDGGSDTVTPPDSNHSSGVSTSTGKLPNTGTSMALLVAFALAIAGVAYVARRAASKRVR